jgi:hypothetical protein
LPLVPSVIVPDEHNALLNPRASGRCRNRGDDDREMLP